MVVKVTRADGSVEMFKTDNYMASKENLHPLILKIAVYDDGKKVFSMKRKNAWFYKHFTFKSEKVQNQLREIERMKAEREKQKENKESKD